MAPTEHTPRLAGAAALLAGLAACLTVAVDGDGHLGGGFTSARLTIYGPGQAALAAALALSGALLLAWRRPAPAALPAVAGLLAAQLAGTGLVGFRRWPLFWGANGFTLAEPDLVRAAALVMAGICTVAAATCVVALLATRQRWWTRAGALRTVALACGATVAVAGPLLVVRGDVNADVRDLAAWALMYSLPLGTALALTGWMRRTPAVVVLATAGLSTVAAHVGEPMLTLRQPWGDALVLVVVATAVVATSRLWPTSPRTRGA